MNAFYLLHKDHRHSTPLSNHCVPYCIVAQIDEEFYFIFCAWYTTYLCKYAFMYSCNHVTNNCQSHTFKCINICIILARMYLIKCINTMILFVNIALSLFGNAMKIGQMAYINNVFIKNNLYTTWWILDCYTRFCSSEYNIYMLCI